MEVSNYLVIAMFVTFIGLLFTGFLGIAIRLGAGFPDCHDDPAPIRVLAGDRGLDQR